MLRIPGALLLTAVLVAGCLPATAHDPASSPAALETGDASASAGTAPVTPVPAMETSRVRALGAPEVLGFVPWWQLDEAARAIDLEVLTTLAWFGVEASGRGSLVRRKPSGIVPPGWAGFESPAFRELQARAQAAGVRVVVTIQRFGWQPGGARRTAALLRDPVSRQRLATEVAALVAERGLDGVNLDLEPVPEGHDQDLVALVLELRAALDAIRPGLQLTVDAVATLTGYDVAALTAAGAADALVIMGYNYRGAGSAASGSQAPLHREAGLDLSGSVALATAGAEPGSILLALPWYGRAWSTQSPEAGSPILRGRAALPSVNVSYAEAAALAAMHGRQLDAEEVGAWTAYPARACSRCPESWRQVWYDDPDTFGVKVSAALDAGLGGVGIWALGHEDGRAEMWAALRWRLRGEPADLLAPTGTARLDPMGVTGEHDGRPAVGPEVRLLLEVRDDDAGSGVAYVRVSLASDRLDDGALALGRTYPSGPAVRIDPADPAFGGMGVAGAIDVYVQWRDIAGGWSEPVAVPAWWTAGDAGSGA
jgi:spore germination protein YaaH